MPSIRWSLLLLAATQLLLAASTAGAAEFGVTPLRVDLDNANRNGLLTVSNEGSVPLKVNIRLMRWTQSANGEEQYADSDLLLFFPRSMTIDPMDKRVVRIGLKAPLPAKRDELAFRLYLEEAPADDSGAPKGQVQFRFRFGIPIFVAPSDVKTDTVIESAELTKGQLLVSVANRGTETVRFETFSATAAKDWEYSNSGLYHFPGTSRRYEIAIPPDKCRSLRAIRVELKSEKLSLAREVPVALENCAPGK
jgi:fimbrial chaperone protein